MPSVVEVYVSPVLNCQPQAQYEAKSRTTTYTLIRTYRVRFDAPDAGNDLACFTASDGTTAVPLIATLLPGFSPPMRCRRVTPKINPESPVVYDVEVEWSTDTQEKADGKWNFDIAISGVEFTQDTFQDKNGNPILNTAKQYYDPTVQAPFSDEEVTISYDCDQTTVGTVDAAITACRSKVNSGPVSFSVNGISRSYDARGLYLKQGDLNFSNSDAQGYWKVKLVLHARADGYHAKILDRGCVQLDAGGNQTPIYMGGQQVTSPVNLDANGKVVPAGGAAHFSSFDIEKEADFTGLFAGLS